MIVLSLNENNFKIALKLIQFWNGMNMNTQLEHVIKQINYNNKKSTLFKLTCDQLREIYY